MNQFLRFTIALLCVVGVSACHTTAGNKSAVTPACDDTAAPKLIADDSFRATLWQQTAAEYDALSLQVYARADAMLDRAIQDSTWSALDPSESPSTTGGSALAIISDIDETLGALTDLVQISRGCVGCSDGSGGILRDAPRAQR